MFHEVFIFCGGGGLKLSNAFIDCLWVPPCTVVVMVMSGLTFHLVALSVGINELHLLVL